MNNSILSRYIRPLLLSFLIFPTVKGNLYAQSVQPAPTQPLQSAQAAPPVQPAQPASSKQPAQAAPPVQPTPQIRPASPTQATQPAPPAQTIRPVPPAQDVNTLLLKNFRPHSIYKIPVTHVERARFPIIDMHSHEKFVHSPEEIERWVQRMDRLNIQKTIIMSMACGKRFDSILQCFSKYGDHFEVWCGIDYTGYTEPGWSDRAVRELERCFRMGARGVGELGDKGLGDVFCSVPAYGMHFDDPRMKPLFRKCGEWNKPVNIHVSDPVWMYEPMDSTNDGLMNAYEWRIDPNTKNLLNHDQLVQTLENVVRENPGTTFIACHLANCEYDLSIIGNLLDKYPNLYTDIGARYAETATIPRYMNVFFNKYQDRILYGTDMDVDDDMYKTTFRILETNDEHFYAIELTGYHWPLQGFGLSNQILEKLYRSNALKIIDKSSKK